MTAPTDSIPAASAPTWKRVVTIVVPLLILALGAVLFKWSAK